MENDQKIEVTFSNMDEINFLAKAESKKEYHQLLSEIIWRVPQFNDEELRYLSNILRYPVEYRRGPKQLIMRDVIILEKYFVLTGKKSLMPRLDIIHGIMADHKLTFDAARKIYDRLRPKAAKAKAQKAKAQQKKKGNN